jgi:small subunit ribosomal protein S15Ae
MQKKNYIGDFEIIDDRRGGKIVIELLGRLNKCGVISPRLDLKLNVRKRLNIRISKKL